MSAGTEWHADERLLAGYVAGTLALPAAMSLEQHVMRCAQCRDTLSGQVDPRPLDRVWQGIEARVEGSARQRWRRLLFRLRQPVPRPALPTGRLAVGGTGLLSAGFLGLGLMALGLLALSPARGPVWDRDLGGRSVVVRQDHGMRPGDLPAARGWSSLLTGDPAAPPIRGAI